MRRSITLLSLFFVLSVLYVPRASACFGDKLGIGHLKGSENEFGAQLIALYIKEKTGIDSVVNEFAGYSQTGASLKDNKTDIIIMTGKKSELDNERLTGEYKDSKFFTVLEDDDLKVVLRVSKIRLDDIKFFTLNKVMERIGRIITPADFKSRVNVVTSGEKFPKEAAREYLLEKDLI